MFENSNKIIIKINYFLIFFLIFSLNAFSQVVNDGGGVIELTPEERSALFERPNKNKFDDPLNTETGSQFNKQTQNQ